MTYPEDSLQSLVASDDWWLEEDSPKLQRGSLVWSFAPHIDQVPYQFEPIGRTVATEHSEAEVQVSQVKVNQPLKRAVLPVAAMNLYENEVWAAYRAKKRPCIVFSSETVVVSNELIKGKSKNATAPTFLAAPFYGVNQNGKRAGYSPEFVERVRHCEYCQFHWDKLPISSSGTTESILRLDHLQPFGRHHDAYSLTGFRLSDDAMDILDDLLNWLIWGGLEESSVLITYRELIEECFLANSSP